ncbi:MAG TPA: U32 family peptidase, partial [Bacilli bacterium]|nr:U32 family peptidase [Bacilli bacterium]
MLILVIYIKAYCKRRKIVIELLAPAGDLEKLKVAILYGANAVYIGGKKFSLRARASNFSLEEIKEAVIFAHHHQAKVYITMNIVPHNDDFDGLEDYLQTLDAYGVDGIIVTSLSIAQVAKEITPRLERHLSTQFSASNSSTVNLFKSWGFSRVILAREVSLQQIKAIVEKTDLELEVFIHGGMCVSYSGRCMLSNHMTNRDANRGGCAHSCRLIYQLFDHNLPISEDQDFAMGSTDLCGLRAIPTLIDMGISSLKIEGRMKSIHYIATVVRSYRMLIDEYYSTGTIKDFTIYEQEIAKAENRTTGTGFLFHKPGIAEQVYNNNELFPTKEFIGTVLEYNQETGFVKVEQRNFFAVGDVLEIFGPNKAHFQQKVLSLQDELGNEITEAPHPLQIVYFQVSK